ncbi:MAG TPA: dephospho-CoA kinase [Spirochaetota bacterium]|nr:dephospho-CoA kinase [Spirochaetota bacterium]
MRVGVTGIYASGKGTVCAMFEELGATVVDTDIIAREIVEPGSETLGHLVAEFGNDILNEDGTLDRRKLANIVFKDSSKVAVINSITHPAILRRTIDIAPENSSDIFMINTPLLFESGFDKYMDKNIVVTADRSQAVERGIIRDNITKNEIEDRLNNQISLNEKVKRADYVIDNSHTIENTRRQVISIWKILTHETRTG